MSSRAKILISVGVLTVLLAGAAVAATLFVSRGGTFTVDVEPRNGYGDEVHVNVPAALVRVAVACLPPGAIECNEDSDVHRWLPVARAAMRELANYEGDADLILVERADENVHIAKRGDNLVIRVESEHESVHVSVPFDAAESVLAKMSRVYNVS